MASVSPPTGTTRCGACAVLGWSCSPYCVFAKCFPRDRPNKFAIIQRVFETESLWNWLARIVPSHRVIATDYLLYEATLHLRRLAKFNRQNNHPLDQDTLIYPDYSQEEGAMPMRLGTAADAIRVTVPPLGKNFFPGESSGVKGIED